MEQESSKKNLIYVAYKLAIWRMRYFFFNQPHAVQRVSKIKRKAKAGKPPKKDILGFSSPQRACFERVDKRLRRGGSHKEVTWCGILR